MKCYPAILATFSATCITFTNTIITVTFNTFEGAVSKINGATGIGEKRDQIYVMPFVCQKV